MSFRTATRLLVTILFPLAFFSTTYLYLYPIFHRCAFPVTNHSPTAALREALTQHWPLTALAHDKKQLQTAPFRVLVLADPQLEGDSSLPQSEDGFLQRLDRHRHDVFEPNLRKAERKRAIRTALKELLWRDMSEALQALRKRLDLFGNDYYLAHIFRTLRWWAKPTHITVLGDLIGSQWVTDEEFEARAWRYWNRVFAGGQLAEDDFMGDLLAKDDSSVYTSSENVTGLDWKDRIINVAGNHDIGYSGDVSKTRIARFEKHFGRPDWDLRFEFPNLDGLTTSSNSPSLHLIVLNDLTFDAPALEPSIQSASYDHLNTIITQRSKPVEDRTSFTLLLTHVPLYKPESVCTDSPFFDYHRFDHSSGEFRAGGLKEQNHLSDHVSRSGILEGIYGMTANRDAAGNGKGRNGLILTGHDHEGCDVWHYIPKDAGQNSVGLHEGEVDVKPSSWESIPWRDANISASHTSVREITLRSMMGEFGGNAGLLSLWFDFNTNEWQYEMQMCELGVQHIWWVIHVLDFVTMCIAVLWFVSSWFASSPTSTIETDERAVSETIKEGQQVAEKALQ